MIPAWARLSAFAVKGESCWQRLTLGLPLEVGELLSARQHLAVDVELAASPDDQMRVLRACRAAVCRVSILQALPRSLGSSQGHQHPPWQLAPVRGLTKVENQDRVERLHDRVGELGGSRSGVAVGRRCNRGHAWFLFVPAREGCEKGVRQKQKRGETVEQLVPSNSAYGERLWCNWKSKQADRSSKLFRTRLVEVGPAQSRLLSAAAASCTSDWLALIHCYHLPARRVPSVQVRN